MANHNAQGKIPNVAQHGFGSFRTDLFGRIKTAEAYTIFESVGRYELSQNFSEYSSGTASLSYDSNINSAIISIGSSAGDIITLESFKIFPHQTGKSLQVIETFCMAEPKANLRQRVGFFSRDNGAYIEVDGTTIYLVVRSKATGSVVDTRIPQSQWNIDALDGDGPSDYVLDITKVQMFWIEISAMAIGTLRFGFNIDGYFIPVHQVNTANLSTIPIMQTASLPIRYELENTGNTSGVSIFKKLRSSVISNGGLYRMTEQYTVVTDGQKTVGTSYTPLVALRLAEGRTDSVITTAALNIYPVSSDDFEWALMKNPTTLIGGTWTTYSPKNNVQFNRTATSMSGGFPLFEGFFGSTNQNPVPMQEESRDNFAYQLGRTNTVPAVSDVFVLCCRVVQGTGTVKASLSWHDLL
jgi:hypothetical protein